MILSYMRAAKPHVFMQESVQKRFQNMEALFGPTFMVELFSIQIASVSSFMVVVNLISNMNGTLKTEMYGELEEEAGRGSAQLRLSSQDAPFWSSIAGAIDDMVGN